MTSKQPGRTVSRPPTTRRQALRLAGAGAIGLVVSACSDDSGETTSDAGGSEDADRATDGTTSTTHADGDVLVPDCTLTPQQTEGPYYLDDDLVRSDITEGQPGTALALTLTIVDAGSCAPLADVPVDLWSCNASGVYSGFEQDPGGGDVDARGETFCRGTQVTDGAGEVAFTAIVPGWYEGRLPHMHVKVHPTADTESATQLYFPAELIDSTYAEEPYTARGPDPTTIETDVVLRGDATELDTLTVAASGTDTGWKAGYVIGIDA